MAGNKYDDGEVLGLKADGQVIQWNAENNESYVSGERLDEYGIHNLRPHELERVGITPEQHSKAIADYDASKKRKPSGMSCGPG